jgi:hypothetical protein
MLSSWNLHWQSSRNVCLCWCQRRGYNFASSWAIRSVTSLFRHTLYILCRCFCQLQTIWWTWSYTSSKPQILINFNPSGTKGHLFTCKNPTGQATFNILQVLRFAQLGGYRLCSAHDAAPNGKKLLMFQRYVVPFKCQEPLTQESVLS